MEKQVSGCKAVQEDNHHLSEKSQAELDFFGQQVNAKLSQIEELTVSIATDREVQNQLSRMQEMEYLSPEYNYSKQHPLPKIIPTWFPDGMSCGGEKCQFKVSGKPVLYQ